MNNEETIIENTVPTVRQEKGNQHGETWKYVTLGGVPGIFLGAGLGYGAHALAQPTSLSAEDLDDDELDDEELEDNEPDAELVDSQDDSSSNMSLQSVSYNSSSNDLRIAEVSDSMSFGEAFAAARAQVGPGGVFYWHGGVYGTYYETEWNAMSAAEKHDYAELVRPAISANNVPAPTDAHPDVVVNAPEDPGDVTMVVDDQIVENFDMGDDVHIVGFTEADGHLVVGYDTDDDGMADVAIIDIDDTGTPSDPDIIIDDQGNVATVGDFTNEPDMEYDQSAYMENPEVAPDMPDYMNDAQMI